MTRKEQPMIENDGEEVLSEEAEVKQNLPKTGRKIRHPRRPGIDLISGVLWYLQTGSESFGFNGRNQFAKFWSRR